MAQNKPDLIMVAGLGAVQSVYDPLLKLLEPDYDIHGADHPAELPDTLDWEFFFQPIHTAAAVLDSFYVVGHSLGGAVALKYAARYPEKVRRVVAVAPVLFPFHRDRITLRVRLLNANKALWAGNARHFIRSYRSIRARVDYPKARQLYAFTGRIDLADDLAKLANAVIFYPVKEEVIPRSHIERVEHEYPNIEVRYVPGSHQDLALAPRPLAPILCEEFRG